MLDRTRHDFAGQQTETAAPLSGGPPPQGGGVSGCSPYAMPDFHICCGPEHPQATALSL